MYRQMAWAIERIVKIYARKCWWADIDELRQVAWVAALEARQTFDPSVGEMSPYAYEAVKRGVFNYLIHESSPVSSSWHDRFDTIGIRRSGLEVPSDEPGEAPRERPELVDERPTPDEQLADARWGVAALGKMLCAVGQGGKEGLMELLRETPRVGARSHALLESMLNAESALRADPELLAMLQERTP